MSWTGFVFPTGSIQVESFYNPGNPEYFSRYWRARNSANELPTSSVLTDEEKEKSYDSIAGYGSNYGNNYGDNL